jgi:hypothetical protein
MLEALPAARTLVLHHPDCLLHMTGDSHQEHPRRLEAILQRLAPASAAPTTTASADGHNNGGRQQRSDSRGSEGGRSRAESHSSSPAEQGASSGGSARRAANSLYDLPSYEERV